MARLPAAPAVSLREVNGAWWLVAPGGEHFVSLGLNQVEAPLMLAPNRRRHTLARYGDDFAGTDGHWNPKSEGVRRWVGQVRKDFQQWGFNTFGYHTVAPRHLLGDGLYYVCRACTCPFPGDGSTQEYPDLFATDFVLDLERRLGAICTEARYDAACLGYAFADRLPWQEAAGAPGLHPWVRQLASYPAATAAKQAWIAILRRNHGDATSAARAYGLDAEDWGELAKTAPWPDGGGSPASQADNQATLALLADRWYRLHSHIVRREDPDRLILGDKLHCGAAGLPEFLLPIVAEYTDLLCVAGDIPFAEQAETLGLLHQRTGLPILLATSAPAATAIDEAGMRYADQLRAVMEAGYVVGWHYNGYLDGADQDAPPNGLVDGIGSIRTDAVTWFAVANQHADIWHARPCR